MKVSTKPEWIRVDRASLAPGDMFQADLGGARVLGMVCVQGDDRLGLQFTVHGSHVLALKVEPFDRFSPRPLKFLGDVLISPIRQAGSRSAPLFPQVKSEAKKGVIVVNPDHGNFIVLEENFGDEKNVKIFINLETGVLRADLKPSDVLQGSDVFSEWNMIGKSPNGSEGVFCSC